MYPSIHPSTRQFILCCSLCSLPSEPFRREREKESAKGEQGRGDAFLSDSLMHPRSFSYAACPCMRE